MKKYVLLLLLTLVSVFFYPGYEVLDSDQLIYVPAIYNQMDPDLFSNDLLVKHSQTGFTIFDEIIVFLAQYINLFSLFFILSFITRFILFISLYHIAEYFFGKKYAIFIPLLFLTRLLVYGSAIGTLETELHPRTIALAFSLWYLSRQLNKKPLSELWLTFSLMLHAPTAAPFVAFHYLRILIDWKNKFSPALLRRAIIPVLGVIYVALTQRLGNLNESTTSGLIGFIDPTWFQIIYDRSAFTFVGGWGLLGWAHVAATLILVIYSYPTLKKTFQKHPANFTLLLAIPIIMTLLSIPLADILKTTFFTKLLLPRSLILVKILAVMLFGYHVLSTKKPFWEGLIAYSIFFSIVIQEHLIFLFLPALLLVLITKRHHIIQKYQNYLISFAYFSAIALFLFLSPTLISLMGKSVAKWMPFVLIGITSIFIASLLALYIEKNLQFWEKISWGRLSLAFFILLVYLSIQFSPNDLVNPITQDKNFVGLCGFALSTPKDSLFLTSPDHGGSLFRSHCVRNVFVTHKDGGQAMLDREFAIEWNRRMKLVDQYEYLSSEKLHTIATNNNIDFVITTKQFMQSHQWELEFQNSQYHVYSPRSW